MSRSKAGRRVLSAGRKRTAHARVQKVPQGASFALQEAADGAAAGKIIVLPDGRRYASIRTACRYGHFSVKRCYELLDEKRIKAKKFGKRALVNLDSIDEMYANLPDFEREHA